MTQNQTIMNTPPARGFRKLSLLPEKENIRYDPQTAQFYAEPDFHGRLPFKEAGFTYDGLKKRWFSTNPKVVIKLKERLESQALVQFKTALTQNQSVVAQPAPQPVAIQPGNMNPSETPERSLKPGFVEGYYPISFDKSKLVYCSYPDPSGSTKLPSGFDWNPASERYETRDPATAVNARYLFDDLAVNAYESKPTLPRFHNSEH